MRLSLAHARGRSKSKSKLFKDFLDPASGHSGQSCALRQQRVLEAHCRRSSRKGRIRRCGVGRHSGCRRPTVVWRIAPSLCSITAGEALLVHAQPGAVSSPVDRVGQRAGLPPSQLYQFRHGGASHDVLCLRRNMLEVIARGPWTCETSSGDKCRNWRLCLPPATLTFCQWANSPSKVFFVVVSEPCLRRSPAARAKTDLQKVALPMLNKNRNLSRLFLLRQDLARTGEYGCVLIASSYWTRHPCCSLFGRGRLLSENGCMSCR